MNTNELFFCCSSFLCSQWVNKLYVKCLQGYFRVRFYLWLENLRYIQLVIDRIGMETMPCNSERVDLSGTTEFRSGGFESTIAAVWHRFPHSLVWTPIPILTWVHRSYTWSALIFSPFWTQLVSSVYRTFRYNQLSRRYLRLCSSIYSKC